MTLKKKKHKRKISIMEITYVTVTILSIRLLEVASALQPTIGTAKPAKK